MFHYSLFSFFRAHWKISMLSEALSERLLRNKNWPSPMCTVLSTGQNKNTLIFPHEVGCVNTGGNSCIQHEGVENSPKHHHCTQEQTQNRLHLPSTSPGVLMEPRWQGCPPGCAQAAGNLPQVSAGITCLQTAACTLPGPLQSCSAVHFASTLKGVS